MSGGGMIVGRPQQSMRNQEATIYIGNLDDKATEGLLIELFVQVGPVVHAHIPRDRITQQHQGYGFIEFQSEEDAEYAAKVMGGVRLFGKPLRINRSSVEGKRGGVLDVGANLFVGNLAPEVDERMLLDTFICFGTLIQTPKVAREEGSGASRGYGFVSYDGFEAADAAIEAMNGQFLGNRPIAVNYAYKKDGKGERHGSAAERLVAAQMRKAATGTAPVPGPGPGMVPGAFSGMGPQQAHPLLPVAPMAMAPAVGGGMLMYPGAPAMATGQMYSNYPPHATLAPMQSSYGYSSPGMMMSPPTAYAQPPPPAQQAPHYQQTPHYQQAPYYQQPPHYTPHPPQHQ